MFVLVFNKRPFTYMLKILYARIHVNLLVADKNKCILCICGMHIW